MYYIIRHPNGAMITTNRKPNKIDHVVGSRFFEVSASFTVENISALYANNWNVAEIQGHNICEINL